MRTRRLLLCRTRATEHFKARRRQEVNTTLRVYGDVDRRIAQAEAHHIALRAETVTGLNGPPAAGRRPRKRVR